MRISAVLVSLAVVAGLVQPAAAAPASSELKRSLFTPVAPVRVLDTRDTNTPVGPGATITLDLSSRLPESATAVVVNIAGTGTTAATFITAFPADIVRPDTVNLNLAEGETRAGLATTMVNSDRLLKLYNNAGSVHLIADLTGYYRAEADGGSKYKPVHPTRIIDTRTNGGPLGPGATRAVDLSAKVPADATAVTFNLTATGPTAGTYLTAWPHGTPRPGTSNLNVSAGMTTPNLVTLSVGADRVIDLYNYVGSTDVIVDLFGYYGADGDSHFLPTAPRRVLDTRTGQGRLPATPGPVGPGDALVWQTWMSAQGSITGIVASLTAIGPTADTYIGIAGWDLASVLNLTSGQTATNLVAAGTVRDLALSNHAGSVHLIGDVNGHFSNTPPPPPPNTCAGNDASCVYAWGRGDNGALGDGRAHSRVTPEPVPNLPGITGIGGGLSGEIVAVHHDGTVFAWGEAGLVVPPGGQQQNAPVQVPLLSDIIEVEAGYENALALKSDGTVWSWGDGSKGQIGDGQEYGEGGTNIPKQVVGLTGVVDIASGYYNGYALKSDGTVWAWGDNSRSQLGNGVVCQDCYSNVPVQVAGLTGVISVSEDGFALKSDGTVWTWGMNASGMLGIGEPDSSFRAASPIQVTALSDAVEINGCNQNRYTRKSDGTVWAWGPNNSGQIGNGTLYGFVRAPVQVSITDARGLGCGEAYNGYAITADGSLWSWGSNLYGQLGDPNPDTRSIVPVKIPGLSGVSKVSGHYFGALALVPHPR
jgi:alpha-tubulin suppressor-like RCC1 family protein